jgi:hypothetical protein
MPSHVFGMNLQGADLVGYMASSLVFLTFTTSSMRALRMMAIASNISFIGYAALAGLTPILVLHGLLLPLNLFRLYQIERQAQPYSSPVLHGGDGEEATIR